MGRIGSTSLTLSKEKSDGTSKEIAWDKHPDWRPLAITTISFRGYNGEYHHVTSIAQSWNEIRKKSDETESHSWTIYKHPIQ